VVRHVANCYTGYFTMLCWVKKCIEYDMECARPRGRPKKTWREIVEKDFQVRGLNREDAMGHIRWMKQIRDN